jgi:hypothetical protein
MLLLETVDVQGGLLPLFGLKFSKPLLVRMLVLVGHEAADVVLDDLELLEVEDETLVANVLGTL